MTKRKRSVLISALILLFIIITPLTIFYSLGWRFDWQEKKITRPGIFFFKVNPNSVKILINGKLKEKTDFFFGSAIVENLLPKKYQVEIKKQGFHDWKKDLEIKGGEVTEAKNIILIPRDPGFKNLSQKVDSFYFSPDQKKIIFKEKTKKDSDQTSWALKLYELDTGVKSHIIGEEDFSEKESQLLDLEFSPDSKRVLAKLEFKKSVSPHTKQGQGAESAKINEVSPSYGVRVKYFILKIDETPAKITSLDFLSNPDKVYFHPTDKNKLFTFTIGPGKLKEVNISTKETSTPFLEKIVSIYFKDNSIYYLTSEGFLFKNNLSFDKEEKLNQNPFPFKKETEYKIKVSSSHIFLEEADNLYLFNPENDSFKKISSNQKGFKISSDSKKLSYFNNFESWVYFLENTTDFPQKKQGDKVFITRLSKNIENLFWYTNHYLIFNSGKEIKIAEIDDRDRINIVTLAEFKNPQIFWNNSNQRLYILSENNFYESKILIP